MNQLTLEWHDLGQDKIQIISEHQPSKNPGTVRLGRDPQRCDIVLGDPTVSGLHVEIFFQPQDQNFYIRNLRLSNPPIIDERQLIHGEMPLRKGSLIYLGQMELKVTNISVPVSSGVPATILIPHHPRGLHSPPQTPAQTPPGVYGLVCPRCQRISSMQHLDLGCPWCGTSLAAAMSALMTPSSI
ncbi:MAG: FHA domain-containing protein [Nostocaceae cyanobacterium]|nr:FHA domain-containing protein [Nostocaceae cyanobacterium]